ncbi:UBX domain-containing protein 3 [Monosporozyma unispora]|nr:hypothetical protein C6P44_002220 [Kazachstania unispora]
MNIFGFHRNTGDEGQRLGSLPGAFPTAETLRSSEPNDPEAQPIAEETVPQDTTPAVVLHMFLQIPLYILYYLASIILIVLSILKPILNFNRIYDKRHKQHCDHSTEMTALLEEISSDSYAPNVSEQTSQQYMFGSIYNSDMGAVPSQYIQNSYLELLDNCSTQYKFGLIYLHDPIVTNRMSYVNNILCSERFVNCIKTYQMLLWFGDVTTSEGLQVANALKVRKFPCIGILAKKTSETAEIIYSFNGPVEEYNQKKVEAILVKKYPSLLQMIEERQNIDRDRHTREQQDERFRDSLRRDQERERQRDEARQREQQAREREALKKQWLLWRKSKLHPEPNKSQGDDVSRIAIRLDNNERKIRNFSPSLPVEEIYAYVELVQTGILDSDEQYQYGTSPPAGYQHQYKFKLIIPVPRQELDLDTLIGDELGIYPSGNIIVEALDEES